MVRRWTVKPKSGPCSISLLPTNSCKSEHIEYQCRQNEPENGSRCSLDVNLMRSDRHLQLQQTNDVLTMCIRYHVKTATFLALNSGRTLQSGWIITTKAAISVSRYMPSSARSAAHLRRITGPQPGLTVASERWGQGGTLYTPKFRTCTPCNPQTCGLCQNFKQTT